MDTIRYKLIQKDIKFLYYDDFKQTESGDTFRVKASEDDIFVDILDRTDEDWAKLKLYYPDGNVVIGWTCQMKTMCPLEITNQDALFDGRFNS